MITANNTDRHATTNGNLTAKIDQGIGNVVQTNDGRRNIAESVDSGTSRKDLHRSIYVYLDGARFR